MQPVPPNTPENAKEIAENIRSGEFFRESLQDYHIRYNDIISERYFYLGIIAFTSIIFLLAVIAMGLLYPLATKVPFAYYTADIVEDLPSMKSLGNKDLDPNALLVQFLLSNYVKLREEYSVDSVERNANGVKSQSTDEVYNAYQTEMDPRNPDSPIAQFQRQSIRRVEITGFQPMRANGEDESMMVNFDALISSSSANKKIPMRAIISFRFEKIEVDQNTGKITPHNFVITQYRSETLGT